jgi:hypothetical protein
VRSGVFPTDLGFVVPAEHLDFATAEESIFRLTGIKGLPSPLKHRSPLFDIMKRAFACRGASAFTFSVKGERRELLS